MATGILGTAALVAATDTTVYTVPESTFAVISVNLCNRSGVTPSDIRVAVSAGAAPSTDEYIEFDSELLASGVIERTGLVVEAGKNIVIRSSTNDVSAVIYGIETATS